MRITNKHGLPEAFVRAVTNDDYEPVGDISVTGLINPPQMSELIRRNYDEIEEDASERVYALLGSAVHYILGRSDTPNALQEERLTSEIFGWTISGKPDLYEEGGLLSDWKVTSVWAFIHGVKREWLQQLNMYAVLYREHGFDVKRLEIDAILRDWVRSQAGSDGYPAAPALKMDVALWRADEALRFMQERVSLHRRARDRDIWDSCTDEERWLRGEQWAVIKKGQKRAVATFGTGTKRGGGKVDAQLFAEDMAKKNFIVRLEYRPGANVRCEAYCAAAPFCDQWKAIQIANEKGTGAA